MPLMLLTADPAATATALAAGELSCPHDGCRGGLGPWGHARTRFLRISASRTEAHTPRRAICRRCRRTQVIGSARSYPRRPDTVETVGAALLAAARGAGHRPIAELVGLPVTTVRGWLRRARANSEIVRVNATISVHELDPMAHPLEPTGTALGDMVDAVGRAVAAHVVRIGPSPAPWQLATLITRAGILSPRPRQMTFYASG